MDIRPDLRHYAFSGSYDNHTACRKCGTSLMILPDDRRNGFCFDCIDLLDTHGKFEVEEGRLFSPSANGRHF